jgi:ABC-2 type transport system permease protein
MEVSAERIRAVVLQEVFITGRSVEVMVDLPLWSLMTVIVFGFVTRFLASVMNPTYAQYLYLGTLLWEIMRIAQYSMTLGALWNVWSRNFSNMFITPLSMLECVVAQMISALVKALFLFSIIGVIAAAIFDFNVFSMGTATLSLGFVNLLWFGYTTGLFILSIIFRLGTRIQALAWGLLLVFQPLTAAFFPLSVMPPALQAVALAFPPTYVFEAARAGLSAPDVVHWDWFFIAGLENVVYFGLAAWFFQYMYRRSRETGQFARNED